ncbi:Transmembrane protease serine 12 [Aphelenchoides bicaudatus]|nr:Transmembrane protease serine 12 [Aphelenchoides bicaudatus]
MTISFIFILWLIIEIIGIYFGGWNSSEDYSKLDEEVDSEIDEGPMEKILGGNTSHVRPWIGQVIYNEKFACGCSLISDRYALTAAHCVRDKNEPKRYRVKFGNRKVLSGINFNVQRIIAHPNYNDSTKHYDAALLLFDEVVRETKKISIIRLAQKSPDVKDKCIVNGWGITDKTANPSKVLKELNVSVIEPHICNNMNSTVFDKNTMICVNESKNAGTCRGDSGSPLVCSNNK